MGSTQSPSSAITAATDALVMITKVESIEVLNATSALVTFTAPVEDVLAANFSVTDVDEDFVFIDSVELNEAKTEATLNFFDNFTDEMTYTVVTSGVTDANGNVVEDTDMFTYTAADPASIEFIGTSVAPGDDLVDFVKVTDTMGRTITGEVTLEYETSNTSIISAAGVAGAEGTAIVVAKVDVDGTYIKTASTVVTVSDAVATTFVGYYIYDVADGEATDTDAFNELTADEKITYVNMGVADNTKYVALYFLDQYGDSMNAVTAFTVTNKNPGTVIVESADGEVLPMSVGTGYVKVTVEEVEKTIAIQVKEAAEITTMTIDPTAVSTGDVDVAPLNEETVAITYVDQFDADVATAAIPATGSLAATSDDEDVAIVAVDSKEQVTVTGLEAGTATITLTYTDTANDTEITKTFGVTVSETGTLVGYLVDNAAATLDLQQPNDDTTPDDSLVKVFGLDSNGNKISQLTAGALAGNFSLKAVDVDGEADSSIVEINGDLETVDAVAVGTGYVEVYVDSLLVETLEYNVVDTTLVATTVKFNNLAIAFGEVDPANTGIDDAAIQTKLNALVTLYDQNGDEIAGPATFVYTTTNKVGFGADLTTLTEDNATATLVVTSVVSGGENLISTPVVVQLSAKTSV